MKEIPIKHLGRTITAKRLVNAVLSISSLMVSMLTRRPYVWGRPFIATIEPANLCNLRCPLCVTGNGQMKRKAGLLDFPTFKKFLDEVGDFLFYMLLYQQGEPYLNNDFLRFVRYAKRKKIFVTTSTNGHYLGSENAAKTVASGLDSMIVSIDGIDQASYEIYRVGGELEKVKSGVRNLVREKKKQKTQTPKIYIQFIVMQHNQSQIAEMKNLTKSLGADKLLIKTVQVESAEEATNWLPAESKFRRYHFNGNSIRPKRLAAGPCPRPWTSTLMNCDGSLVPCCFDKNGQHPMGQVKQTSHFEKAWHSDEYSDFRTKMLRERRSLDICSNCSQGLRLYL